MLVQVDHVALTGTATQAQANLIESIGYKQVFSSGCVSNPQNKRPLMKEWCDYHTLALYEREGSIPIEIIDYGHTSCGLSRYELRQIPDNYLTKPEDSNSVEQAVDVIDTIVLKTASPTATQEFLTTLGIEKTEPQLLRFRSPLDRPPIFIDIVEDPSSEGRSYLDTVGFPCLAFVTTDIDAELSRLADVGYEVTKLETINLPNRSIDIGFVLGPSGAPIELVEPQDGT